MTQPPDSYGCCTDRMNPSGVSCAQVMCRGKDAINAHVKQSQQSRAHLVPSLYDEKTCLAHRSGLTFLVQRLWIDAHTLTGRWHMSFVIAAPEFLTQAASDLANIGSTINAASTAAAAPTAGVLAAGADEVSAAVAALFAAHAQGYQALSAQVEA